MQLYDHAATLHNGRVVELSPHIAVPADQAWFWTERWQQREREVDEHVAAGRITVFDHGNDFLEYVESPVSASGRASG